MEDFRIEWVRHRIEVLTRATDLAILSAFRETSEITLTPPSGRMMFDRVYGTVTARRVIGGRRYRCEAVLNRHGQVRRFDTGRPIGFCMAVVKSCEEPITWDWIGMACAPR